MRRQSVGSTGESSRKRKDVDDGENKPGSSKRQNVGFDVGRELALQQREQEMERHPTDYPASRQQQQRSELSPTDHYDLVKYYTQKISGDTFTYLKQMVRLDGSRQKIQEKEKNLQELQNLFDQSLQDQEIKPEDSVDLLVKQAIANISKTQSNLDQFRTTIARIQTMVMDKNSLQNLYDRLPQDYKQPAFLQELSHQERALDALLQNPSTPDSHTYDRLTNFVQRLESARLQNWNRHFTETHIRLEAIHGGDLNKALIHGRDLSHFLDKWDKFQSERGSLQLRDQIDRALGELQKWGSPSSLSQLDRKLWYKLYIDKEFHAEAEKHAQPGKFFDRLSQGYFDNLEAVMEELATVRRGVRTGLDVPGYERLYQLAASSAVAAVMRQHNPRVLQSGIERRQDSPLSNIVTYATRSIQEKTSADYELLAAFKEMQQESIHSVPLLRRTAVGDMLHRGEQGLNDEMKRALIDGDNYQSGRAHVLTFKENVTDGFRMLVYYPKSENRNLVDAIFHSYKRSIVLALDDKQKLREIARLVRNLNVLHPHIDGNVRTNVFGLMNKSLIQEGFCPAILPDSPHVFGGEKTLDGLVLDMIQGMQAFDHEVRSQHAKRE